MGRTSWDVSGVLNGRTGAIVSINTYYESSDTPFQTEETGGGHESRWRGMGKYPYLVRLGELGIWQKKPAIEIAGGSDPLSQQGLRFRQIPHIR